MRRRISASSPPINLFARTLTLAMILSLGSGCSMLGDTKKPNNFLSALISGEPLEKDADAEKYAMIGRRDPNRLMLSDFSPDQIGTTLKVKANGKQDQKKAQVEFEEGMKFYRQASSTQESNKGGENEAEAIKKSRELFNRAGNHFRMAADLWLDSSLEQDALFMMGESYFFADRYVLANRAYELLVGRYSGTRHLDRSEARRFEIARYWLKLAKSKSYVQRNFNFSDEQRPMNDLPGHARRILHSIRLDDPTGKLADDSTMALANAYFEANRFADAAETYKDLRQAYPGSRHQFHAHLFEFKSRMESYQGKSYNDEPLLEADKILKAIVQRFPEEARNHQDYLGTEAVRVRGMLAERDYSLGQYFEKRGENRAADIYYTQVAENFVDTEYASLAKSKSTDLSELPAVPEPKLKMLSDLFPEPKSTRPLLLAKPDIGTKIR